jgi:hypothetical protein
MVTPTPPPVPAAKTTVSPTLTSASLVPPVEEAPLNADFLTDNTIVARPLQVADITRIKSKNPNLAFQWVNRSFGDGQKVTEHEYEGFRKATPADAEVPGLNSKDGGFIYGDLVLMKIDKAAHQGALRHIALRSLQATRPAAVKKILEGDQEFKSAAARSGGKIHPYSPTADEMKEKGLAD